MNIVHRVLGSAITANHARGQTRYAFKAWEQVSRDQARRVNEMARYAYEHVPYYQETMRRLGLGPSDFQTADDLQKLPLLDRDLIQRDPEYLVSKQMPLSRHLRIHNSGTTGKVCTFFWYTEALYQNRAMHLRSLAVLTPWLGRTYGRRRAQIRPTAGGAGTVATAHREHSMLPAGLPFDDRVLSPLDPPEKNLRLLNEFKPELLTGYGSYLAILATYLQRTGQQLHLPKAIVYSADGLPYRARCFFEQLGIRVFSKYSATEAPELGFECEQHTGLHVNADAYPTRIVDDDGRPALAGQRGEVVISNLLNRATVLLNYRLSDVATMNPDTCPCGRSLPLLTLHEGRVEDWITLPSGESLHPQAVHGVVKSVGDIWQWQLVQKSPRAFLLQIVSAQPTDLSALGQRAERGLRDLLGSEAEIEIDFVEEIGRTPGAKLRPVVSLLADPSPDAERQQQ